MPRSLSIYIFRLRRSKPPEKIRAPSGGLDPPSRRSEEHTSALHSPLNLVFPLFFYNTPPPSYSPLLPRPSLLLNKIFPCRIWPGIGGGTSLPSLYCEVVGRFLSPFFFKFICPPQGVPPPQKKSFPLRKPSTAVV